MNTEEKQLLKRFEEWIEYTEAEMKYLKKGIQEIKDKTNRHKQREDL